MVGTNISDQEGRVNYGGIIYWTGKEGDIYRENPYQGNYRRVETKHVTG